VSTQVAKNYQTPFWTSTHSSPSHLKLTDDNGTQHMQPACILHAAHEHVSLGWLNTHDRSFQRRSLDCCKTPAN